jgi:hypothetical protein
MPNIISNRHNEFIDKFYRTGRQNVFNNELPVIIKKSLTVLEFCGREAGALFRSEASDQADAES